MTYAEAPFTATLKSGGNNNAPWITVRADTADELENRLRDVYKIGPAVVATATAFSNEWSSEDNPQVSTPAPWDASPAQAVADGLGGQVVSTTPTSPAPPASTTAPAGGAPELKRDKWGAVYEFNHPSAPQTQHGPKVLKHAKGKDAPHNPYSQWLYPTDKAVPGNYEAGQRDTFPKEFAKGVEWKG